MRPASIFHKVTISRFFTRALKRIIREMLEPPLVHPGYSLFNGNKDLTQVPLPTIPIFFDLRYTILGSIRVLRAPFGEAELDYWPRESDNRLAQAIDMTYGTERYQGLFWFHQSEKELYIAISEFNFIQRELKRTRYI